MRRRRALERQQPLTNVSGRYPSADSGRVGDLMPIHVGEGLGDASLIPSPSNIKHMPRPALAVKKMFLLRSHHCSTQPPSRVREAIIGAPRADPCQPVRLGSRSKCFRKSRVCCMFIPVGHSGPAGAAGEGGVREERLLDGRYRARSTAGRGTGVLDGRSTDRAGRVVDSAHQRSASTRRAGKYWTVVGVLAVGWTRWQLRSPTGSR